MLIDSTWLYKKLNSYEIVNKVEGCNFFYKQGYLSGVMQALLLIHEAEYIAEHGHERPPIELPDMDPKVAEALRGVMEKLKEKVDADNAEVWRQNAKDLYVLLDEVCKDQRERYGQDDVCGLCHYGECAHMGPEGDWIGECPGFNGEECFTMRNSIRLLAGVDPIVDGVEEIPWRGDI